MPFFLYLAFNAPQEYLDQYKSIADPSRRAYAASIPNEDAYYDVDEP
jgi:hypothetical protein